MAGDSGPLLEAYVRLRAKAADGFEGEARQSVLPGITRLAQDAAGVVAAAKIWDVAKEGFEEYSAAAKVDSQTEVLLRNQGDAARISAEDVKSLGDEMLNLAGFDDEAARSAANVLLRFGAIKDADTLKRVETDAADLAVAMGTDLPAAAQTLGQALQNPEQGLRKLRPVIGTLTDEQKASIKSFTDQGDAAGAQAVVLKVLEDRIGGTAKAYGETLPGQVDKAKQSIENTKAALVGGMAPALEVGAQLVKNLSDRFQELPEGAQEAIGLVALIGGGLGALVRPAGDAVRLLNEMRTAHEAAAVAAGVQAAADEGLAVAEGEAALASGALAAALGPIGIIAAAAGAVFAIGSLIQGNHDVKKATVDYTQALQDQNGVLEQNIDNVSAHALAQDDAARTAHDAGLSYGAMFDAIRNGGPELDKFTGALKSSGGDTAVAIDYLKRYGAETDTFGRHLLDLVGSGKLTVDQVTALAESVAGLSDKYRADKEVSDATKESLGSISGIMDSTSGSADGLTGSLDEQAKALDAARTAAKALSDQYRSIIDGTISAFDAELALSNAQIQTRASIEALNKARKEGKLSNDEGVKATNDTFNAILNEAKANETLVEAQAKARGETLTAAEAQKALVQELYGVASTLDPGSDLQTQLGAYITQLQTTQGTFDSHLNLDSADAVRALQEYQRQLAGVTGDIEISFTGTRSGSQARATGGPVYAGQVFRGAEFGAEDIVRLNDGPGLYRAPFDGYVRTAPETAAGSGGSQIVEHNTFNIQSLREPAERAIRRELERRVALARR